MSCNTQNCPKGCLSPNANSGKNTTWLWGTEDGYGASSHFLVLPVLSMLPLMPSLNFSFIILEVETGSGLAQATFARDADGPGCPSPRSSARARTQPALSHWDPGKAEADRLSGPGTSR